MQLVLLLCADPVVGPDRALVPIKHRLQAPRGACRRLLREHHYRGGLRNAAARRAVADDPRFPSNEFAADHLDVSLPRLDLQGAPRAADGDREPIALWKRPARVTRATGYFPISRRNRTIASGASSANTPPSPRKAASADG